MSRIGYGPGMSRLVCVASKKYPRYSEADMIGVWEDRLLMAVTRKEGAGDFARGTIIGVFSDDGGLSWDDEPRVIVEPWDDVVDVMSVSFCASTRGTHLFFLGRGKNAKEDTRIYYVLSEDEGKTWGKPVRVSK